VTGRVRLATEADLPAIDAIYNQAIAERFCTADLKPIGEQRRREWFDAHNVEWYPAFVYEEDRVLGWLSLSAYRPGREALQDVAEISYYVDEAHRGKGIGSRLMEHALAESVRIKKRVLFAVIIEGNDASAALLKKFGFEQWGILPQVIACYGEVRAQIYLGKILI
jgi:L-amino acid N-acyltransferase YncA